VPELVRLEQQLLGIEAQKRFFETGPFLLDHTPHEAGAKHPVGHGRKHAVVGDSRHGGILGHRRQQRRQNGFAALAIGRAFADLGDGLHTILPRVAAASGPTRCAMQAENAAPGRDAQAPSRSQPR
jgi:hypothetical protein